MHKPSSTYTNAELIQFINQNKNESRVDLSSRNLIDEDMKIVATNLLENNRVSIIFNLNL